MDKPDKKDQAAEALIELRIGELSDNAHADWLKAAFEPPSPLTGVDLERVRRNILSHKKQLATKDLVQRPTWPRTSIGVAATALLAAGLIVWLWSAKHHDDLKPIASVAEGESHRVTVADELNIHIRGGRSINQTRQNQTYTLKADSFYSIIKFEPKSKLRQLRFEMPLATFEIIGTVFMLNCDKDTAFLAVSSGAVRVRYGASDIIIRGGEFWSASKDKAMQGSLGVNRSSLFDGFEGNSVENQKLIRKISSEVNATSPGAKRELPKVTVSLKTGSVLRGVLLSERNGDIEIQTPATGAQVLRFNRDEIAEMHFHLPK